MLINQCKEITEMTLAKKTHKAAFRKAGPDHRRYTPSDAGAARL